MQGTLAGDRIRRSLDLTSWEAASALVRDWEVAGEIGQTRSETPDLSVAVTRFLADARARKLSEETVRKYENLLSKRFLPWCEHEGIRRPTRVDVDAVRMFRATWDDGALYATKNLERLRAFFRFCEQSGWVKENPASSVKAPRARHVPTLPFSRDEMQKIYEACSRYRGDQIRLKAFVSVMRYSGLRIGDALALTKDRIAGNRLFLYTQKTGTPVYVPLPPVVVADLAAIQTTGDHFFVTGRAKSATARANWSRYLASLFRLAGIEGGHSHRFRDTFAVELLLQGVSLDHVSVLLGHSSIKITERHYSPWVKARQEQLEEAVAKSW